MQGGQNEQPSIAGRTTIDDDIIAENKRLISNNVYSVEKHFSNSLRSYTRVNQGRVGQLTRPVQPPTKNIEKQ